MNRFKAISAALLLLAFVECLQARGVLDDYFIPKCTLSPNHRYGVSVWNMDDERENDKPRKSKNPVIGESRNSVIELASGRAVAVMNAEGASRKSYGGRVPGNASFWNTIAQPRWSADSSLLLWRVNGKWSPQAIVLVSLEKNAPPRQLDVRRVAQQAILARTRKARPQKYSEVKQENGSFGTDGFAVDVYTDGEDGKSVSLPLVVHADLASNLNEDFPNKLASQLDGILREDGTFVVTRFKLALRHNQNF